MPRPSLPKNRRSGFSLVEVVLALGVVAAAVLALIGILGSTFTAAREVALQHRAINAISSLSGALQSASGIKGMASSGDTGMPAFEKLYNALKAKGALDGKQFVDLFVYQKSQDKTPAVPVVFQPASGNFTMEESLTAEHDGIDRATVFRLRLRVSKVLEGRNVELDQSTFEPKPGVKWSAGQSLPATLDGYALAFLPLSVEVYPHDFTEGNNPGMTDDTSKAKVLPVLTAPVVINR